VIDLQVTFPAFKELLDLPAHFIDTSDLLGREILAIVDYPGAGQVKY
jgi:hypothetical protein